MILTDHMYMSYFLGKYGAYLSLWVEGSMDLVMKWEYIFRGEERFI